MNNPLLSWLLQAVPDPVILVDPEWKVLEVNQATEKALQRSRNELINSQLERDVLRPMPEQLQALALARSSRAELRLCEVHVQGVELAAPVFQLEIHPTPEGEIAVLLRPIPLPEATLRRAPPDRGLEPRASQLPAPRLNFPQDDYLATAVHGLRTPLSAIGAFTQLALNHATESLDPCIRRALDVTTQQCAHMNQLINEIVRPSLEK